MNIYDDHINRINFCLDLHLNPLVVNENALFLFFGYCAKELHKSGNTIDHYLSAITAYWRLYNVQYKRSSLMSFTIRSLKIKFPVNGQKKKPFTHLFVWWIYNAYYDAAKPSLTMLAVINGMLFGYFLGCRPSEYCYSYHKGIITTLGQLDFIPAINNAKEMIFTIPKGQAKTNRHSDAEILAIDCQCQKTRFGLPCPCPVHTMIKYIKMRCKLFKGKVKRSDPLLVTELNKRLKYCHINDFLHKAIRTMSEATGVPLSPFEYTPHSLRTGGTTDLARLGRNALFIQKFGRWQSNQWKQVYIQLDFRDLAKLRNETTTSIRDAMRHRIE